MSAPEAGTDQQPDPSELDIQTDSFAGVLAPVEAESGDDRVLQLWGRLWGLKKGIAAAVYARYNVDKNNLIELPSYVHTDPNKLEPYDPDKTGDSIRELLQEGAPKGPSVSDASVQMVKDKFGQSFSDSERLQSLVDILESKNRTEFKSWMRETVATIITSGDTTFQFKGQLSTKTELQPERDDSPSTAGDQSSNDSKPSTEEDNRDYRDVALETSSIKGKLTGELRPRDTIYIRLTGDLLEKVPDKLKDSEYEDLSIPIEATVLGIEHDPDLPDDFDGDADSYLEVKTKFLDDYYGKGHAYKSVKIKGPNFEQDEDDSSSGELVSPFTLISSGIIIALIILLAYLTFGI